ncbi:MULTISPECIES: beta-ketoacyl-ACP synthase II [unclassified Imperialibacter]|uniref:beta-ketoacyl-ACP synthase II n=1 Tax=unclassified Imperialibacter TaxID=2629706 RepID=UPI001252B3EF|nr:MULTISPECIES: beta-ketoacyl-ACP synthase II [unclassified Imperialibacter]CAD5283553.1 3-oxoacyl-(acyl-carrier-protein) synthase 2 [Imperialibacter sp. 89]CAD5285987.1 3-oxoacyl-(acyl-carrier-protein) synthase 2 [Imperialibacter sp. 75]VVT29661.1 3-oxoacyl-(acyl-carrier-protein) synthase 2 [Imperialibacter sp. EC-SDR9]
MQHPQRVVITGLGAITPLGNSVKEFWDNLAAGKSGAANIKHFNAEKFKTRFACEVKDFDPSPYLERSELRRNDLFSQYAIAASEQAIADSGILNFEGLNRDKVGVIWASGNGGLLTLQENIMEFALGDGTPRFNPFLVPKMIVDIAAGLISMRHGFRGPNYTTVSACASSNTAIIDAFNYIKWGKAVAFVTGGSEAAVNETGVGGFGAMKALSTRNDSPETASRPYDIDRDGFVIGEGAGALILESLDHATRRGATIYGEVVGGGMSADAYHLTATHPEGEGAALGMRAALEDAEINPESIDYINTHGTSTPVGDPSELKGIMSVFGDHAKKLNISSTKSMTGHLLGGAGAIEALAGLMAIQKQLVPPTINIQTLDPELPQGLNLTVGTAQERKVDYVMSNTFGFGGHNATVILKRFS